MPPRPKLTRDLDHPDFPHGEPRGRARGCDRPCCVEADRRHRKLARIRRERGIASQARPAPEPTARTAQRRVAQAMADDKTLSRTTLAAALGIPRSTLSRVIDGKPVSTATVRTILARLDHAAPRTAFVPGADYVRAVNQLRALGYSLPWQEEQTGTAVMSVVHSITHYGQATVRRRLMDAIEDLAERIDGKPPVDADRSSVKQAQAAARKAGYYPPQHYNPDGTLNYATLPDHPVTIANTAADDDLMEVYRFLKALDGRGAYLAAELLVPEDAQPRTLLLSNMRKAISRFHREYATGASKPGHMERRRHMRDVIEDYQRGAYGSPVAVALALGVWSLTDTRIYAMLMPLPKKGRAKGKIVRPSEPHPGIAEAETLAHLHPLVAVPIHEQEAAA